MENQELLKTMDRLDSQLTILNIEGIQSECAIYEWKDDEVNENDCHACAGFCEVMCNLGHYHDCDICEGSGILESSFTVSCREVETWSNILI